MTLRFDPASHTYTVDGRDVPGVTSIIKRGGFVNTAWFRPEHAERGTRVHDACLTFDLGGTVRVDDELAGYLAAYTKFVRYTSPQWEVLEEIYYHEAHQYAGRVDRAGFMPASGPVVLDIKTGTKHIQAHGLQLAAYDMLLPASPITRKRFGLYLSRAGTFVLHEFGDDNDYAHFLALKETA